MVFSSHLFLLLFLPLTLAGFYALARENIDPRWPRRFLILASLVFYGVWSWFYLGVLIATILGNFALGRLILRSTNGHGDGHPPIKDPAYARSPIPNPSPASGSGEIRASLRDVHGKPDRSRRLVILGIVGNLCLLGYYKYANFFLGNLNLAMDTHWSLGEIILPLAISFHTFQQIAFLVSVYRGKDAEASIEKYLLFVLFFPQLIAGPIVRHEELAPQFAALGRGRDRALDLAAGSALFIAGLCKKTLLADPLAVYANTAFSAAQAGAVDPVTAWLGALAYTLQLYFDFSGYSEMAVGLGRMFGLHLPINFWSPYQASNIAEFWRRWHITLSRFLRDFLYIPLGGNRVSGRRTYANLLVTMGLGGLWHGAAWTFVLWGLYHGLLLAMHRLWRQAFPRRDERPSRLRHSLAVVFTFLLVALGWVLFRAADLQSAMVMYRAMAKLGSASLAAADPWAWAHVGVLLVAVLNLPNTWRWIGHHHMVEPPAGARQESAFLAWKLDWRWAASLAFLAAWAVLVAHRYTEFLYFQF